MTADGFVAFFIVTAILQFLIAAGVWFLVAYVKRNLNPRVVAEAILNAPLDHPLEPPREARKE